MKILSGGQANFFGLDLGTTSIRAVQLKGSGSIKTLYKYGHAPVSETLSLSDSPADQATLGKAIQDLVASAGIETRRVAVNIPSNQVFSSVIEMDRMPEAELAKTIQYQAGSFIPTPLEESKIDWAVIGDSPADPKKVEVLLSSVPNKYVEKRFAMLEAAGFKAIAFEPDSIALMRAIVPADAAAPQMVLDIGRLATDLIITMDGNPHLTRAIPAGTGAFIKAAVATLGIDEAQASQFIYKFGLGKDKLDGQIYNAILPSVETLMVDVEKSIKFFANRYPNSKIERIIVTGGASSIPELPLFIANRFAMNVEVGNAWRNVSFPPEKQNELLAVSNHFGVAVGLAERSK
jgi:type IV pilus assembly protein PilM